MSDPDPTPALPQQLRERCAYELSQALRVLADPAGDRDQAVHEARKCVRRVRAWLRLAPSELRAELATVDDDLRRVRRTLGPLRDARTRIEAVNRLRKRADLGELRPSLQNARKGLAVILAARWQRRNPSGRAYGRMLATLAQLVEGTNGWPLEKFTFKHARVALAAAHGRACKARRQCAGRTGAVMRHEWRGRVRILVLQCQLLEACGYLDGSGALKELGQRLGEEHDLAVLSRELGKLGLPPSEQRELRAYLLRRRLELARQNDRMAADCLRVRHAPKLHRPRARVVDPQPGDDMAGALLGVR